MFKKRPPWSRPIELNDPVELVAPDAVEALEKEQEIIARRIERFNGRKVKLIRGEPIGGADV